MIRRARRAIWFSPVVLAAGLLQPIDCHLVKAPALSALAVEVPGEDLIEDFHPSTRAYGAGTREGSVLVRAAAQDPDAHVTYQLRFGEALLEAGVIGIGGGEVTSSIPVGGSTLNINVTSEGRVGQYTVELARGLTFPCTEQGVFDAFAFGGGPHAFDCDGPTTVVTQTEVRAERDVSLDGQGELTIENGGAGRVLFVAGGVTTVIESMTLTGGRADYGGALYNEGRTTLIGVRIVSNRALQRGGGIYGAAGSELILESVNVEGNTAAGTDDAAGGGLYLVGGTAAITNSVVENNVVRGWTGQRGYTARGGGLFVSGGELAVGATRIAANSAFGGDANGELSSAGTASGGGLYLANSAAVIANSAVSDNVCLGGFAQVGGGFANGGGVWQEGGVLTIEGTTINNNLADGMTGPWEAGEGGGLVILLDARFAAVNSTISGNRADFSEAMEVGLRATAAFYNSTIAFNSTDESHSAFDIRSDSEVTLSHTILSNAGRCFGSVQSLGYNLFGPNFECGIEGGAIGDVVEVDPQLEPLADNGGPTLTHAISQSSPALDAGDPSGCAAADGRPLTRDQRGATRPQGICDIGAVEIQQP